MNFITPTRLLWRLLVVMSLICGLAGSTQAAVANHGSYDGINSIPQETFDAIRDTYRIFYGHTSHGSQIVSGLDMLADEDASRYAMPTFHEISDDLGHTGDTSWVAPTRQWLNDHPEYNMVMWSWCGGCSDNNEDGINTYLAAMNDLEMEYPQVTFIYMTGHLDGGGPDGNLYRNNNQIREYCTANNKHLFDFADIESFDPNGNYYPDERDTCGWCYDWCAAHDCPSCSHCAHSHCFNCYQKGKAFWVFLAEIAGMSTTGVRTMPTNPVLQIANYPNPFNPQTEIHLNLKQGGQGDLAIYSLAGDRVATLHSGQFTAGQQTYQWQGRDGRGRPQGSGVYLCRLELDGYRQEIKMTLLK